MTCQPSKKVGFFLVVVTCQVLPACSGSLPRDVDTQPHHAAVPKARDGGSHLQGSHPIIVQANKRPSHRRRRPPLFCSRLTACFKWQRFRTEYCVLTLRFGGAQSDALQRARVSIPATSDPAQESNTGARRTRSGSCRRLILKRGRMYPKERQ